MKCLYKLIFGTVLTLNFNNNSIASQFDDFNIGMLDFINSFSTSSVNNNDLTQSKVNCVLSVYSTLCINNIADLLHGDDCISTIEKILNVAKEADTFMNVLKNNNIKITDYSSPLSIYYELCNVHLKNALKKNDIDTSKKILKLSLEKINQEKQQMKNNFDKSKNMSASQKKVLLDKMLTNKEMLPQMLSNDIEDLKARKKTINEFNTSGDDTITIINDIIDSGLSYLYYKKFYLQALAK